MGGARGRLAQARAAYRSRSTDVTLEATRTLCVSLSMLSLSSAAIPDAVRSGALRAHTALLLGVLVVLALLPAAVRRGQADRLAAVSTAGTVLFFVAYSAVWHDVPDAGSVLGLLALVEAPVRYGLRGLPFSVVPVTATALLWPQRDAAGSTQPPVVVLLLVTVLCGLVLLVRETTHRSARALASATQGFAEATLHLPLGVGVLDADGRVLQANPALTALLGPGVETSVLLDRFPPEARAALVHVLEGASPDERVECRTDDDRWLQVGACVLRLPGPRRTVVHVQDVTSVRRERADLLHASRHDALTGLLARRGGEQVLESALRGDTTDGRGVAVLFVDLDGFKRLNDTAGHAVGDAVLRQAAARLSGSLRPTERAVRWGGDEFVVVCHDVDGVEALEVVAKRLLAVLREPFRVQGLPLLTVSGSVGAVLAKPGDEPWSVLALADRAMYEAKEAGGDCWVRGTAPLPAPRSAARHDPARTG